MGLFEGLLCQMVTSISAVEPICCSLCQVHHLWYMPASHSSQLCRRKLLWPWPLHNYSLMVELSLGLGGPVVGARVLLRKFYFLVWIIFYNNI